jgi:hypothetical protein
VWSSPVSISITSIALTGIVNWPLLFLPQPITVPFDNRANECVLAAAIATIDAAVDVGKDIC